MKRFCLTALIGAVLALPLGAHAQTRIKIGTEGMYPPFNYVEGGEIKGFDVDIARALCAQAKLECEFVIQDWDGIIPALLAHRIDAIAASLSITEERKQRVAFTDKYYSANGHFVAPKSDKVTDVSPAALAGKVIGVQGSTTHLNYLETYYQRSTVRTYATADDANADLAIGRLDLTISDKTMAAEWLKNSPDGSCCELVGGDLTDPLFGEGVGVGLRKEDNALRETFNAAIKAILADGTYKAINDKYFDVSIY